jgi:hypothetical protein
MIPSRNRTSLAHRGPCFFKTCLWLATYRCSRCARSKTGWGSELADHLAVATDAVRTYFVRDFPTVNVTSAAFWVPVNSITFLFLRPEWRSTFMGGMAFIYGVGWSLQQQALRGRRNPDSDALVEDRSSAKPAGILAT